MHVLIIEDEPLIAMDIEQLVESLGHKVTGIARTHKEALSMYGQTQPKMILADIPVTIGRSGLILVLTGQPGTASVIAQAIDDSTLQEQEGTLAVDNTLIVLFADESRLERWLELTTPGSAGTGEKQVTGYRADGSPYRRHGARSCGLGHKRLPFTSTSCSFYKLCATADGT